MEFGKVYLECAVSNFKSIQRQGERTLSQLSYEQISWKPHEEANSIAIIIKHLHGNMRSRWTDFLMTDGEKLDRNRDGEFAGGYASKEEVLVAWRGGWGYVFQALQSLTPQDLFKVVHIRGEVHSVMQAIERQIAHYASHIGQIIYVGKLLKEKEWECLSIPRGQSNGYLQK